MPDRPSAIVTWADPDGSDLAQLGAAGITASGRSGRARVAFHVFNDGEDVDLALAALEALTGSRAALPVQAPGTSGAAAAARGFRSAIGERADTATTAMPTVSASPP